tara:strand:+ start:381 stop:1484 length:1104 start_codon:yes stop_codon:yes gene_type:complete
MKSEGLITIVSCLCTFIGLSASAAYAVTFYMTKYNQLYLSGQSGYDETDMPYTYAIVECCISSATFFIGLLGFVTAGRPTRRAILVCLLFFGVSCGLQGTFGILRAWNLGIIGDDMQKTCSDISQSTGCPTTRFEHVHERAITYASPSGGDCTFWFWGNRASMALPTAGSMMRLVDIEKKNCPPGQNTCTSTTLPGGLYKGIAPGTIEKYMNWADVFSYGWRDDPDEVIKLGETGNLESLMLDKTHNMQHILTIQNKSATATSGNIPEADQLSEAPSIAYCWYWGCNSVCHEQRYLVNRWWFFSSLGLCVLHIMNVIVSAMLFQRLPKIAYAVAAVEPDDEPDLELMVPTRGRRKRQLVQNPSGLMF